MQKPLYPRPYPLNPRCQLLRLEHRQGCNMQALWHVLQPEPALSWLPF